ETKLNVSLVNVSESPQEHLHRTTVKMPRMPSRALLILKSNQFLSRIDAGSLVAAPTGTASNTIGNSLMIALSSLRLKSTSALVHVETPVGPGVGEMVVP